MENSNFSSTDDTVNRFLIKNRQARHETPRGRPFLLVLDCSINFPIPGCQLHVNLAPVLSSNQFTK
ncbi:hypothetical protein BDE02_01G036200 [Populus trichocarpa]|nr:hypothetical protein BDE02_01G036200 [Populus trichocarpa]